MPATSISTAVSWGAYLAASALLVLVLTPTLNGIGSDSRVAGASRTLDGITDVLDGLRPGLTVSLTFVSSDPGDVVRIDGHTIAYQFRGGELNRSSRWLLPELTLDSGAAYRFWMVNDSVGVTAYG